MSAETVLVTGGAGYVGSHACKALHRAGYRPVVLDDLRRGFRRAVRWGPLLEIDLGDRAAVAAALAEWRPVAVMHFAAYAYVGESMRDPGLYYRNNVVNTLGLLDAMVEAGVRSIVFSSTCATYGDPVRTPIDEEHPQRPVNPYGETKLAMERALHWYGACHGIGWAALRYFNAAGADPDVEIGENHDPETHLVPLAIAAASGGAALQIFGTDYPTPDGTAIRDYVHVRDLAEAHVLSLGRLRGGGGAHAVNLGTGSGHSVQAVIEAVERRSNRQVPAIRAPRRAGDPPMLVADATKARNLLGWQPACSDLATIVDTAWRWHARRRDD
ncbi:MAG: UDP-glucose 4-epimerase GalE [Alphaproteobacteria bacterium]|nr:UDP-glucose 4-epimerase GalE [Alphaproteobacteria bacterium]